MFWKKLLTSMAEIVIIVAAEQALIKLRQKVITQKEPVNDKRNKYPGDGL